MPEQLADRLEAQLDRLERNEVAVRQDIARTQELLVRAVADIELELHALQEELKLVERELQRTVGRAKDTVGGYRNVVKRQDMLRVQNRVDVWAPEKRITREQFRKLLEDSC